jgi:hypothetical protein
MSTTVETSSGETLVRDKAVRLFTYLKELTELRGNVRRNCDEYDQVIWWAEIPREEQLVRQLAAVYGIVRKTAQVRKMLLG